MNNYAMFLLGETLNEKEELTEGSEIQHVKSFQGYCIENCIDEIEKAIQDNIRNVYAKEAGYMELVEYNVKKHNRLLHQSLGLNKNERPSIAIRKYFGRKREPLYLINANVSYEGFKTIVRYVIIGNNSISKKKIAISVFDEEYEMMLLNGDNFLYIILTLNDESEIIIEQNSNKGYSITYKDNEETTILVDDLCEIEEVNKYIEEFLDKEEKYIEF